jgi:hypothetical protein
LGVAGDFGCKLRSRYLVLVLEQPFHALCYYKLQEEVYYCVSTLLWAPPAVQTPRDIAGAKRCPLYALL